MKEEISNEELLKFGLEKLDDALQYIDELESFEGKNLAALIYIAIRYGEGFNE